MLILKRFPGAVGHFFIGLSQEMWDMVQGSPYLLQAPVVLVRRWRRIPKAINCDEVRRTHAYCQVKRDLFGDSVLQRKDLQPLSDQECRQIFHTGICGQMGYCRNANRECLKADVAQQVALLDVLD